MSVPVQTPVASFTANGVTTVFPYAYLLLSSGDLQVTLDGVVLTSGFVISGVGSVSGGNVTFSVAPASGTLILRRKMSLSRLVDYVEAGDLLAATLNLDLDRIWMVMQGLQSDATRSIKLPEETLTDQTIADDAATRASKLLGFDALGNVSAVDIFDPSALIVSVFIETLLSAANSVSARSILEAAADNDVVKLSGDQTVGGVKTFGSSPVLPGNASTSLQAVPKQQLDAALSPSSLTPTLFVRTTPRSLSGSSPFEWEDIPSWARQIVLVISGQSGSSTGVAGVRIGTGGAAETSGYSGSITSVDTGVSTVANTSTWKLSASAAAASIYDYVVTITNVTGNTWTCSIVGATQGGTATLLGSGSKTLAAALDMVQFNISAGSFDAGTATLYYR